jgi:Flp pilus assembly protein TadD
MEAATTDEAQQPETERPRLGLFRLLFLGAFLLLLANSAYLYVTDDATFFYLANIGLHLGLGLLLGSLALVWGGKYVFRALKAHGGVKRLFLQSASLLWTIGIFTGGALAFTGSTRPMAWLLYTHILACIGGLAAVGLYLRAVSLDRRTRSSEGDWWQRTRLAWQIGAVALPGLILVGIAQSRAGAITNPPWAPASMEAETADPRLHPSSIRIKGAEWMPDEFFTETASRSCGESGCHPDIYKQWQSSAHHFSSFNNQWYRKAIEYMQEVQVADAVKKGGTKQDGLKRSQWCAGCHDPSILLTGRWTSNTIADQMTEAEQKFKEDPKKWERLHSGLGCLTCHSAVHVNGSMGQGGLTLEYPALHKYSENPSPIIKSLHNYLTILDPGPHRKLFLKPFHTESTAEFCSSCHKVHLDVPVNNYRWIRGFNDYDPWQASGVSGQGARSFYYPPPEVGFKKCANCHMPMVKSEDRGNRSGFVHSHRFPAANTALAVANRDKEQLETVTKFLQNKVLSVDIFALRRGGVVRVAQSGGTDAGAPRASSLMGDENSGSGGVGVVLDNSKLTAPLGLAPAALKRGETVGVDVVVRTRGVGHAFPGGTNDAFDVWVEFSAVDNQGKVLLWSGQVTEGGKGPVDRKAHFYRSLSVDENGNPINKRNAWSARALVYANVIPPGAADTVHYRLKVPPDCGDQVTLTARVNYRKFSNYYTRFSYQGRRDPKQAQVFTADYDNGHFTFDGDTSHVSGKIKGVPDVPIIVMAEATQMMPVTSGEAPQPVSVTTRATWERWNDYGIGLYRQRDFRGAAQAFRNVILARPDYGDGHVHLGQTLLDDGQVAEALKELRQAVSMAKVRTQQGKAYFWCARALFSSGQLDEAVHYYRECSRLFPRDREVSNQLGLALVAKGDYAGAETAFRQTLTVDPEDITANYNLIKTYSLLRSQAAGEKDRVASSALNPAEKEARAHDLDARVAQYTESGKRAEALYERFRADEAAGQRTAPFKRLNPAENNEAQSVHEHG